MHEIGRQFETTGFAIGVRPRYRVEI